MINNRQAGRRRGRNNPRQQGGNSNRGNGDSGNRIDSRARGNAVQLLEKYRNLARDAQLSGDRVNAEYYLQFADHYFRVLADNRARQEEQQGRFRREDGEQDGGSYNDELIENGEESDEFAPRQFEQRQYEQRQPDQRQPEQRQSEQRQRRERTPRDRDGQDRPERTERVERAERPERAERAERPERTERAERPERAERQERPERRERRPRVANDDETGDIGLPGLPPSIARIDIQDEDAVSVEPAAVIDDAPVKPRRGRRPRATEAAE